MESKRTLFTLTMCHTHADTSTYGQLVNFKAKSLYFQSRHYLRYGSLSFELNLPAYRTFNLAQHIIPDKIEKIEEYPCLESS